MTKKLIGLLALLACVVSAGAQSPVTPNVPRVSSGNVAGLLYASNFGQWQVPKGNLGQYSWNSSSYCYANTVGVTFPAFTVGTPLLLVDEVNSAVSEFVTPTIVTAIPAGPGTTGSCAITVAPVNPHTYFHFTSGTYGLQEAINWAGRNVYTVILTPDWALLGGTTGMITAATGNTSVSILDQRTAGAFVYTWNGSAYVQSGGNTPGGSTGQVQYNNAGTFAANANLTTDGNGNLTAAGTVAAGTMVPSGLPVSDVTSRTFAGGADPTCTNDSTAAILAAEANAETVGGELYFPGVNGSGTGCYLISRTITIDPDKVHIVKGDGHNSRIFMTAANTPAFVISSPGNFGNQGSPGNLGFFLEHLVIGDESNTNNSAAAITFTGSYSSPELAYGDQAKLTDVWTIGWNHGVINNGWGSVSASRVVLSARASASGSRSVTAGGCTGSGVGNCSVTLSTLAAVGSGLPVNTSNPFYLTGLNPSNMNSYYGLISIIQATGGVVTGTTGQTCTISAWNLGSFQSGYNATVTITLASAVVANPLTIANVGSITVNSPGIILTNSDAGAPHSGTLASGTATCSGTAGVSGVIADALPLAITGIVGNVVTYTDPLVTTAETLSTGGSFLPQAQTSFPGSGYYITGNANNSMNLTGGINLDCGQGIGPFWTAGVMIEGLGAGEFDFADIDGCNDAVLIMSAFSGQFTFNDVEGLQHSMLDMYGGIQQVVNFASPGLSMSGSLASPIMGSGGALFVQNIYGPFANQTGPIVTAGTCVNVVFVPANPGDTCQETGHNQTGIGPFGNQKYSNATLFLPGGTINRGFSYPGLDYTATDMDRYWWFGNAEGVGSVTAVSGGVFSGSGTVLLSNFNTCTGSTVTVTLSSGSYSSATVTAEGSCGILAVPTTATCTNGTATCPVSGGTINVTATLGAAAVFAHQTVYTDNPVVNNLTGTGNTSLANATIQNATITSCSGCSGVQTYKMPGPVSVSGESLASVTGISGTLGGSGTVFLSGFNGCTGCTATVTLSSGSFASATVTSAPTGGITTVPTTATCTNGTATCGASVTVTTTISFQAVQLGYVTIPSGALTATSVIQFWTTSDACTAASAPIAACTAINTGTVRASLRLSISTTPNSGNAVMAGIAAPAATADAYSGFIQSTSSTSQLSHYTGVGSSTFNSSTTTSGISTAGTTYLLISCLPSALGDQCIIDNLTVLVF